MSSPELHDYLLMVQDEIRLSLSPGEASPQNFYNSMQYAMGWSDEQFRPVTLNSAKMLRPRLCLLTCLAVGGGMHLAVPAAAAVELLHNFTLVHDDIQDNSLQRRHRPSLWSLVGIPLAINSGDGMFAASHIPLYRLLGNGLSTTAVCNALVEFDRAALLICEGQHMDISFESRERVGSNEYLRMINRKTGVLMGLSCFLGALAAGTGSERMAHARKFGEDVGIAYQIRDDLRSVWQETSDTGKHAMEDIYSRKKSYPAVRAFELAEGDDLDRLTQIYSRERVREQDALWVRDLMSSLGIQDEGNARVESCVRSALENLSEAKACGSAAQELEQMARSFSG